MIWLLKIKYEIVLVSAAPGLATGALLGPSSRRELVEGPHLLSHT